MTSYLKRTGTLTLSVVLLALVASACTTTARTQPITATKPVADAKPTTPFPSGIDPTLFDENSANITNPWVPFKPGTQWIWEGQAFEGEDIVKRRVVFTVTDLVKEIAGVKALVGWDRDYNDGLLSEGEIIFLAQDKEGNVWHFGQYREKFEEGGELDGGRSWVAGYNEGAKPGFYMKAKPALGTPPYSQGYAPPPFFWDDYSKVLLTGQRVCVKTGCYSDVLVTEEYEPTKPGASQTKYYARGVGNIRVGWRGNDLEQETMQLISKHTISAAQMAEARAVAMKMEARARAYGFMPVMQVRDTETANPQ